MLCYYIELFSFIHSFLIAFSSWIITQGHSRFKACPGMSGYDRAPRTQSFTARGSLHEPIHLLVCFFGGGRKLETQEGTHKNNMWKSAQTSLVPSSGMNQGQNLSIPIASPDPYPTLTILYLHACLLAFFSRRLDHHLYGLESSFITKAYLLILSQGQVFVVSGWFFSWQCVCNCEVCFPSRLWVLGSNNGAVLQFYQTDQNIVLSYSCLSHSPRNSFPPSLIHSLYFQDATHTPLTTANSNCERRSSASTSIFQWISQLILGFKPIMSRQHQITNQALFFFIPNSLYFQTSGWTLYWAHLHSVIVTIILWLWSTDWVLLMQYKGPANHTNNHVTKLLTQEQSNLLQFSSFKWTEEIGLLFYYCASSCPLDLPDSSWYFFCLELLHLWITLCC